jgi:L-lactate dehydrogenase complex protein LldE
MRVSLFIPCFVDSLMPQVGIAMVKVLENLGHELQFPERQTCCGQPPFNSGCHDEARRIAEHQLDCFRDAEVIVGPSGSCVAMMKKFYPGLFAGKPREGEALEIAKKTWEFSEFLVDKLHVADVGAAFRGKVTFHDGCHGLRELKLHRQPRELLRHVMGLELVEMGEAASCCGFGGSFSVKFPKISTAMGGVKTKSIIETGAKTVVSCDPSCLLQIGGLLKKQGHDIACLHIAEVLAAS